uniref:Serine aminopeptidase S33 domain-containing protein n=2 Tax=Ditylenchus dipsaci TaxID=166011 RepID=A0A915DNK1_9BILA
MNRAAGRVTRGVRRIGRGAGRVGSSVVHSSSLLSSSSSSSSYYEDEDEVRAAPKTRYEDEDEVFFQMKIEIEGAQVNENDGNVCGVSYQKLDEDSVNSVKVAVNDKTRLVSKSKEAKKTSLFVTSVLLNGFWHFHEHEILHQQAPKQKMLLLLFTCHFVYFGAISRGIASVILYFLPNYMSERIFSVDVNRDPSTNYNDLSAVNFTGRNFYLHKDGSTSKNISTDPQKLPSLGTWHILPSSLSAQFSNSNSNNEELMETAISQGDQAVTIYLHGSGSTRVTRALFYNVISGMNFHTIAADYRGYGDSTGQATENGLNDDANTIYNYAKSKAGSKPIIVWSHSMGTAVATRLVAELSDKGTPPLALILSAPFNNLHDVFYYTAYAQSNPLRFVPWFDKLISVSMDRAGLEMATDKNIARVKCPIFIMHAADDVIVPIQLTKKVVDAARQANKTGNYYEIKPERGLGHRSVQLAEEVPIKIRKFLDDIKHKTLGFF